MAFFLSDDGGRIDLDCEYDADEDILYLWLPPAPRVGTAYETTAGHLVLLDPESHELVGVTIFDFEARWGGREILLEWEVPDRAFLRRKRDRQVARVLQPA